MTVVQNIAHMGLPFASKQKTVYQTLPTSNEAADLATWNAKHVGGVQVTMTTQQSNPT